MLSWKPNLNLHSHVYQGRRLLQPASGPSSSPAPAQLPVRPSMSSNILGSPLHGHGLGSGGCFPTLCCPAPQRSGGNMRCNPITSSPWGNERRQEASQKTENKRLSNCLQQNREFHKGMLNLVAPWRNAKIHSHCLTRHRGPEPVGPGLRIIWSVHTSYRHCFRVSWEASKWQCNVLHHVFLKIFFETKRVVCLFFPLNKIVSSFAMKYTELF